MLQGIQFAGDSLEAGKIAVVNKTGGALTVGGVYALDLFRADADTTDVRTALKNLVAVSASNIDGILVIATKALADNEEGEAVVIGPVKALVDGDTTDVVVGDRLKATAASVNLTKASEAAGSVDVAVGKALEGNTATAALKTIYFMGLNLNVSTNAATT